MTGKSGENKMAGMAGTVAPLANVAKLAAMIERCNGRAHGLPGMGCFFGRAGLGKTQAGIWTSIKYDAVHVEALGIGGVKGLLRAIVDELGLRAERTTDGMFYQICRSLLLTRRPLIVDEADKILKDTPIEIIRTIHDKTGVPVILMGEEELPQKLKRWERVDSRILTYDAADDATAKDVDILANLNVPGVALDAALKARLLQASGGSLRYLATNLATVAEFAAVNGLQSVTLEAWGNRHLNTGEAPLPRHSAPRGLTRRGRAA
jgi:DNA transposition AAA+ family ATPase